MPKGQNVVCPALDLDPVGDLPAAARLVMYDDTVRQLIAYKFLSFCQEGS